MDITLSSGTSMHVSVLVFLIIACVFALIVGAMYVMTKDMLNFLEYMEEMKKE